MWSVGKLQAVRRWADAGDIDLRQSWAYSDSVYDVPLLSAVGHPTAVNPDFRLQAAALLAPWPVTYLDSPAGVPKLLGVEPMDVVRLLSSRRCSRLPASTSRGRRTSPARPGHRGRQPSQLLRSRGVWTGRLQRRAQPEGPGQEGDVRRADHRRPGSGLQGPSVWTARAPAAPPTSRRRQALRDGELLIVTPQGTIPRGEAFFDPRLRGKSGVAPPWRRPPARRSSRSASGGRNRSGRGRRGLPNVTNVLHPPTVRVRVGPPVRDLTGEDFEADTERIMAAITAQLPPEANLRRIPTPEELARTLPPGSQAVP